jgi:hypothetical protein
MTFNCLIYIKVTQTETMLPMLSEVKFWFRGKFLVSVLKVVIILQPTQVSENTCLCKSSYKSSYYICYIFFFSSVVS